MKKNLLALLLFSILGVVFLSAQSNLQGINYQGVARDGSGKLMPNANLAFKMSLVSINGSGTDQVHYSETHQVTSDNLGLFHLVIGSGNEQNGSLNNVPWAKQSIFLQTEIATDTTQKFELLNKTELFAVPYAYFAATAERLVTDEEIDLPTEKNQTIYWTTSGNTNTRPNVHFVGTIDKQPLVFKTNNITTLELDTLGRMLLTSNRTPAGSDTDQNAYPLVVKGKFNTQGIWIEIKEDPSNKNNFLTFEDNSGVKGRVEGQNLDDLLVSQPYIFQNTTFAINITAITLNVAALIAELAANTKPWTLPKVVALAAKIATFGIQAASLGVAWREWRERVIKKVGVAYLSSNGDYAEWLKRDIQERDLHFGEIVGVNGGLVSLNTQGAKQLMVISTNPIVLGNEPEETQIGQYEKVAFLGQVLVKIVGPVKIGDYILPSGNNDGYGVALSPDKMRAGDYERIVGVAWEASKNDYNLEHYINVAVGINSNDLAGKVDELNKRADKILALLEGNVDPSSSSNPDAQSSSSAILEDKPTTKFTKLISDEEFDHYLDQNQLLIRKIMGASKSVLIQKGFDGGAIEDFDKLFGDPINLLKKLRRDSNYETLWNSIDTQIKSMK